LDQARRTPTDGIIMSVEDRGRPAQDDMEPAAYFERLSGDLFRPTRLTIGAWNTNEQHIAPLLGLVGHAIERDHRARHTDPLQLCRASFDILGILTLEPFRIAVAVVRPGRTIELVEATVFQNDRPAVTARAWFSRGFDTTALAGTPLPGIAPPEDFDTYDFGAIWDGDAVRSIEARRRVLDTGRAICWARTDRVLLEREDISATAYALGMLEFANGMTPRVAPQAVLFPNLDLTVHLFRPPIGPWIGFDTSVSFGAGGLGLTHSILHDADGPLGSVSQILTVRPR
jgi:hypothetical protein